MTYCALGLNEIGAVPGGAPRTFCEPLYTTSTPVMSSDQGNLMRNLVSFHPCVNAMEQRPYWRSCMDLGYCTFGFGAIIRRDLLAFLLLPHNSPPDDRYTRMIYSTQESQLKLPWRA